MFRPTEVDGSQPNKFNHSKRGYLYPLESPYDSKSPKVANLTHNIFSYTHSPIPNSYSPSNQQVYLNSPTRVGEQHVQEKINHPDNHNANNQKHLVDEEIFQRQRGKGAFAIDRNLTVIDKYDPTKLRGPAYYNYNSPSHASQKTNLNDSLDNFQQTYSTVNSNGYQKSADAFWGVDNNAKSVPQAQPQSNLINRGSVGARERTSFDPRESYNRDSSFDRGLSPNNRNNTYFGLDRTQQSPKFTKEHNVSHLIQQKTLNRTWAETNYISTNPINHQNAINPVRVQQDKYFARPQVLGNGVYNTTYKAR